MKNLTVAMKLIMGFLVGSVLTLVVGIIGINNMGKINDAADKLYQKELVGLSYTKESNIDLIYQARALRGYLLAQSTPGVVLHNILLR